LHHHRPKSATPSWHCPGQIAAATDWAGHYLHCPDWTMPPTPRLNPNSTECCYFDSSSAAPPPIESKHPIFFQRLLQNVAQDSLQRLLQTLLVIKTPNYLDYLGFIGDSWIFFFPINSLFGPDSSVKQFFHKFLYNLKETKMQIAHKVYDERTIRFVMLALY